MVVSQAATFFHGTLFSTVWSRRVAPSGTMKPPFFALHFPTQSNRLQKASKIFCKINCCNLLVFSTKYGCPYILEDDCDDDDDDDDDDCEEEDDDDDECECEDDDDEEEEDCEDDDDDDDDDCEEEDEDDDDDDDCEEDDDDDDDDDDECECDGLSDERS
ncbi:PH domain-containing protein YHR131C-like [Phalaenopsis equestris]|uniref:PH domain-containing protein YHR131C-like n=1 Tax=Phalaenopsis equestris TaxID=78828 RepID=UPI0009E1B3ED|nr:PH domain-containing protein YHR131C-like [Phalaenopsis equestris]